MADSGSNSSKKPSKSKKASEPQSPPRATPFSLSNETIEQTLLEATEAGLLEDYFGAAQYAELQRLAQKATERSALRKPKVLILPGIMGSKLGHDRKGPFDDVLWIDPVEIAHGKLSDLAIPGGDTKIEATGVLLFAYLALKYRLKIAGFDADFHAYDWRQTLPELGKALAKRIDDLGEKVHLVAHSMGGLVARAALDHKPKNLGRIVMLGTPNRGSFSPVQAFRGTHSVVRKVDFIDPFHSAEDLARDIFGTFPGLLEMIPEPDLFDIDLFDVSHWPASGVHPDQAMLRKAKSVQASLPTDHDELYLVVGVDQDTVVGAEVQDGEFVYRITPDGDGTVPRESVLIEGARKTYYIQEAHGWMPNNRKLAEAIGSILASGATSLLKESYEPSRSRGRLVSERSLAVPPYIVAPGNAISVREQRNLLEEFVAPDRTPQPLMEIENATQAAALSMAQATPFADRVVVGRASEHRLEINLAFGNIVQVDAQAYVMGMFRHVPPGGAARALDGLLEGAIGQMVQRRMFNGNIGEVSIVPTGRHPVRADLIAFAGLGPYDTFDEQTLEVVGENLVRTFAATRVDEFALVPLGGGSGRFTLAAVERLLTGFFRGLRDADPDRRFRGITICEMDRNRYLAIRNEIYRLSATALFDGIEVTLREFDLPPARLPTPRRGSSLPSTQNVHLLVRQESADGEDAIEFSASVLTTGAKATIRKDRVIFSRKALDDHLDKLLSLRSQDDLSDFGKKLAEMVLPQSTRTVLGAFSDHPLVVVHDTGASRVPWETIRIAPADETEVSGGPRKDGHDERGYFPSARGGMSHRYEAENLSVAKWLEQRRMGATLDVLLVINPTEDLPGAEEEGKRVRQIFEAMRPAVRLREMCRGEARKQELLQCFASGEFDVVHYAGHAFFDPQDPARSGLVCAFHEVLSGADIASLGSLPSLVFFNACEAGRVRGGKKAAKTRAPELPLQERVKRSVGFAEAFLRGGIANFIGTYWPVGDTAASAFAQTFYEQLVAGETLHNALLGGRGAVYQTDSIDWADYVLYGDPGFVLKAEPSAGQPAIDRPETEIGTESAPLPKRDLAAGTWIECQGPDGTPARTPVLLDRGPRMLKTKLLARVSQGRHRFELTFNEKRYFANVLCRAAPIHDPQTIRIEERSS